MTDLTDDVCTCGLHFPMLSNSSSTAAKGDVSHQKINDLSSAPSYWYHDKNGKCKDCGIKLQANDHMKKHSPIAVALLPKGTWVTRRSISNNQDRFSLWVAVVPGWDVGKNLFDFSPLCVFLCCLPGRMQIHTGCICLTFLHCAFSNVFSNWLPERMQNHTDCICLTFLHHVFSNESSDCLPDRM